MAAACPAVLLILGFFPRDCGAVCEPDRPQDCRGIPPYASAFRGMHVCAAGVRFAVLSDPEIAGASPLSAARDYRVCSLASAGCGLPERPQKVPGGQDSAPR